MLITNKDIEEIKKKCELYKVKNLFLFGSAATDNYLKNSDIDLLVDFDEIIPENYFEFYFNLKDFLTEYFGRDIDLLESRALKNPYLIEEINNNKILIYGKAN
ncbi:MAG: nucleotidyltransferase domain-containing protein [Candidatus Kapabacteria bacterium]|nr:nucleotidyltransferase domain-containing protein [Candidatus Kapabacteria bacterium]